MRGVLAIAGVVGLLGVAGCGAGGNQPVAVVTSSTSAVSSAEPSAAPRSTPIVTARPTPARLTTAQAGKRYLTVTRPYNVALERFEKAANSGSSVQTLRARARSVAATNLAESRLLLSIAWPTSVAAQIRELAKADATARPYWLKVAASDSLSEMAGHIRRASAAGGNNPAAEIRKLLGLPKYDESDYS
ncbi:hypothetical protein [Kribbella catacumbae]|uniref:hypothetical protein n=1 Tax=Kribbella catacumbae TaxID=460086 RepID=UPI0003610BC5|nr:hypothetical protein [Kribbella catacumbae]